LHHRSWNLKCLGCHENWTHLSFPVIDAYAEQVIEQEEHDKEIAWILDLLETNAVLREVLGE